MRMWGRMVGATILATSLLCLFSSATELDVGTELDIGRRGGGMAATGGFVMGVTGNTAGNDEALALGEDMESMDNQLESAGANCRGGEKLWCKVQDHLSQAKEARSKAERKAKKAVLPLDAAPAKTDLALGDTMKATQCRRRRHEKPECRSSVSAALKTVMAGKGGKAAVAAAGKKGTGGFTTPGYSCPTGDKATWLTLTVGKKYTTIAVGKEKKIVLSEKTGKFPVFDRSNSAMTADGKCFATLRKGKIEFTATNQGGIGPVTCCGGSVCNDISKKPTPAEPCKKSVKVSYMKAANCMTHNITSHQWNCATKKVLIYCKEFYRRKAHMG